MLTSAFEGYLHGPVKDSKTVVAEEGLPCVRSWLTFPKCQSMGITLQLLQVVGGAGYNLICLPWHFEVGET